MKTKYFCVLVLLLSLQFGYGQEKRDSSSYVEFMNIPDEVIKKEIAFFSKKSKSLGYSVSASTVKEVPPFTCIDSAVGFNFGHTYIDLYVKEMGTSGEENSFTPDSLSWGTSSNPKRRVGSLSVVTHSHFGVNIPKSAIYGLYEPYICEITTKKKRKKINWRKRELPCLPFYKVFTSLDKRRIYVYMLAGEDGQKYEVTWVIRGSEYLYRVIDRLVSEN